MTYRRHLDRDVPHRPNPIPAWAVPPLLFLWLYGLLKLTGVA